MKNFTEEFDKIKALIVSKEPFAFSRFSDGEVTVLHNNIVVLAEDYPKKERNSIQISISFIKKN